MFGTNLRIIFKIDPSFLHLLSKMSSPIYCITFNPSVPMDRDYNCDAFTVFGIRVAKMLIRKGKRVILFGLGAKNPVPEATYYNVIDDFPLASDYYNLPRNLCYTIKSEEELKHSSERTRKYTEGVNELTDKLLSGELFFLHSYLPPENFIRNPSDWDRFCINRRYPCITLMQMGGSFWTDPETSIFCSRAHWACHHYQLFWDQKLPVGVNGKKSGTFRSYIHPPFFDPSEYIYSEEERKYYLYLGRIQKGKGFFTFLEAVQQLPDLSFKVGAPYQTIVENSREMLHIVDEGKTTNLPISRKDGKVFLTDYPNVELLGYLNGEQRAKVLSETKMLIQPSQYHEPFGFNVIEAYFSGTEVLTSDLGNFREIVPQGLGKSARAATVEQMIKHIQLKEKDPDQQTASRLCRQFAFKFADQNCEDSFLELLEEMYQNLTVKSK